jgi:hypothetical protein
MLYHALHFDAPACQASPSAGRVRRHGYGGRCSTNCLEKRRIHVGDLEETPACMSVMDEDRAVEGNNRRGGTVARVVWPLLIRNPLSLSAFAIKSPLASSQTPILLIERRWWQGS